MTPSSKQPRVRLHVRLSAQNRKRLKEHCAARGMSERAGLEAALTEYFEDIGDPTLLMRRLDRHGRAVARLQRDIEIFMEAFMTFVRYWFAHTPAVAESNKAAAKTDAEARYQAFAGHVSKLLSSGHLVFDDFPRERLADGGELAALAGSETSATLRKSPR